MHPAPPPPARAHFAARLKDLRSARGYKTARSFARALGIDENRYTRYERAEVEPHLTLIMRMCTALDISPNELLAPDELGKIRDPGADSRSARASQPPGFGEAGRHVPPSCPDASSTSPGWRRSAAAWRLAREAACLEQQGAGAPESGSLSLANVRRVAQIYAEMQADPFAFIARLMERPELAHPDAAEQRLAGLIDELVAAINAEAQ
jgi:transcriptional regulator with XRE-family HTH domain